jgi:hypothetical protein
MWLNQIPILAFLVVNGESRASSLYLLTKSYKSNSESAKSEASFLYDYLWHLIKVSFKSAVNHTNFFIYSPLKRGSLSLTSSSALIYTYSSNRLHLKTYFLYFKYTAFEYMNRSPSVALVANIIFLLWKNTL